MRATLPFRADSVRAAEPIDIEVDHDAEPGDVLRPLARLLLHLARQEHAGQGGTQTVRDVQADVADAGD